MGLRKLFNVPTLSMLPLLPVAAGCEKITSPKSSIGVVNNSGHDIMFYAAMGGEGGIAYPDTTLPAALTPPFRVVGAGERGYSDFGFSKESVFAVLPSGTLSVFVFHPDTLGKHGWQEVIREFRILKRYDLSHEDLKHLNWHVYYPPTDEMASVKCFPIKKEMASKAISSSLINSIIP